MLVGAGMAAGPQWRSAGFVGIFSSETYMYRFSFPFPSPVEQVSYQFCILVLNLLIHLLRDSAAIA